jgi:hypothetical protein
VGYGVGLGLGWVWGSVAFPCCWWRRGRGRRQGRDPRYHIAILYLALYSSTPPFSSLPLCWILVRVPILLLLHSGNPSLPSLHAHTPARGQALRLGFRRSIAPQPRGPVRRRRLRLGLARRVRPRPQGACVAAVAVATTTTSQRHDGLSTTRTRVCTRACTRIKDMAK